MIMSHSSHSSVRWNREIAGNFNAKQRASCRRWSCIRMWHLYQGFEKSYKSAFVPRVVPIEALCSFRDIPARTPQVLDFMAILLQLLGAVQVSFEKVLT